LTVQEGNIEVFTTRVDTIYGVTFMVIAPEHELVDVITTAGQRADIDAYIAMTQKKSERDRMSDVKTVSGAFTGAFAAQSVQWREGTCLHCGLRFGWLRNRGCNGRTIRRPARLELREAFQTCPSYRSWTRKRRSKPKPTRRRMEIISIQELSTV
jgi:hypothetical protein